METMETAKKRRSVSDAIRVGLLAIAGNEGLFLFAAFIGVAVLGIEPLAWYKEAVEMYQTYIIWPWGMALALLRLSRRAQAVDQTRTRGDILLLAALLAWIVVPFAIRFGLTFNNASSWHGYTVAYFGIYAMTAEEPTARRQKLLGLVGALFVALSLVLGGMLLYCAYTGRVFGAEVGGIVFGVQDGFLCGGVHYNITGMVALSCAMMCLVAVGSERRVIGKIACAAPAAMMMVVVVLTQSRTARYALLLALAVGCYGALAARLAQRRAVVRHGVALVCAAAVLAGGYLGAARMTDAALAHYMRIAQGNAAQGDEPNATALHPAAAQAEGNAAQAARQDVKPEQSAQAVETVRPELPVQADQPAQDEILVPREAVDATFSDRTTIWKNLFTLWKENPKSLLIGNGVGRTGSRIVEGTIHEASGAVAVHNTYLQYIADFGLIGFALQAAFLLLVARDALRVFLAHGAMARPGGRALCMLTVAVLATGMMESAPLGALTPMNIVLCFALAQLSSMGRELAQQG